MPHEIVIRPYTTYWNMSALPFQNTPDPRFLYLSRQHEEAMARMLYTIQARKGGGLITGVFGCGKTVLVQAIIDALPLGKYKVALVNNPQLDAAEILRSIVRSLRAIDLSQKRTELSTDYLLEVLSKTLDDNMHNGQDTLVVIDEAHIIKDEAVFEQLRLLLNFQRRDRFLLTLLLVGQPELRSKVEDNKPLDQRIALKYSLEALPLDDTKKYIEHRLGVVGVKKPVFTDAAVQAIHLHAGGIPRLINTACDLCLFDGAIKMAREIDEGLVKEAIG